MRDGGESGVDGGSRSDDAADEVVQAGGGDQGVEPAPDVVLQSPQLVDSQLQDRVPGTEFEFWPTEEVKTNPRVITGLKVQQGVRRRTRKTRMRTELTRRSRFAGGKASRRSGVGYQKRH